MNIQTRKVQLPIDRERELDGKGGLKIEDRMPKFLKKRKINKKIGWYVLYNILICSEKGESNNSSRADWFYKTPVLITIK